VTARYAIYYIPGRNTALEQFGRAWLGWDVWQAEPAPLAPLPGFDAAARDALVRTPRQYGFHATLKPPMALAPGLAVDDLLAAAGRFAARTAPVPALDLRLSTLGNFLALTPAQPSPALNALASDCVAAFDAFREALQPADRARRKPESLTARQCEYLDRWGYPWVMAEFRFHMTLSGAAAPNILARLRDGLAPMLEPVLREPFRIDAIAVAGQPAWDDAFRVLEYLPLTGDA
jgi:putative phosphonate metabolism protein